MSLFLSFWMLMASTGFSVSFHYCEGEIVNWSILNDAAECDHKEEIKSCCESEAVSKCSSPSQDVIDDSECCSSDQAKMELESEFSLQKVEFELSLPQFVILSQFVLPVSVEEIDEIQLKEYEKPILYYKMDEPFIQSFLI